MNQEQKERRRAETFERDESLERWIKLRDQGHRLEPGVRTSIGHYEIGKRAAMAAGLVDEHGRKR